ncbi:uncharacterized protein L203_100139 [Cryptococcus depauperatus CBS 7841]|uniref:Borealin N-terminal domain-containing protein n=1 Tax=Cryptococcus depauperatus CBS 7841 TaxID=1295531 RepID=A0AAJ8JMI2_9TREE
MVAKSKVKRAAQTNTSVSTPPPDSRKPKGKFTEVEKQSLLQNFDLEVQDKLRYFRAMLAQTLASYRMREETEILSIPREVRKMTLGEVEAKWGGNWMETLNKVRAERFEVEEKKREEVKQKERQEVVKGKRKRAVTASRDGSPNRSTKSARRGGSAPKSTRRHSVRTPSTRAKEAMFKNASNDNISSKYPSELPQDHVFNPSLPPTPLHSSKIRMKPSPLSQSNRIHLHSADSDAESSLNENAEDEDISSTDDDLPDPEKMEERLMAGSTPGSKSSKHKKKRAPSLIFRQSLGPSHLNTSGPSYHPPLSNDGEKLSTIDLSDGRTISFNPFSLTPGRIESELEEGGVSREEKRRVQEEVHREVVGRLRERMERFLVVNESK